MNVDEHRGRQLRRIHQSMLTARKLGGRPATGLATLSALAVLALAELARYVLRKIGFVDSAWLVSLILMALTYIGIMGHARHKTFSSLICNLLADYEPVNVKAYRELQDETAKNGLSFGAIERWLEIEWDAVEPPKLPAEQQRFVDKQIGPRLVKK